MYSHIVNKEMDRLKKVKNNKLYSDKSNNFLINYEWEEEYSHNEIRKMQREFMERAKEYLSKECPGQYIVYCDWCVHICSIDLFNEKLKDTLKSYVLC